MCGIVGIASRTPVDRPEVLGIMRDTMGHRGPDDSGLWWSPDCRVGLAHRRLAVLDLSPAGHQPMSDSDGRLWITFNGEIYNHRELRDELGWGSEGYRGSSDTETILHAYRCWGDGCLSRLRGMFAFALWDGTRRRLLLARDRCGEKPLFYRLDAHGTIQFASELKALLADPAFPREIDREALEHYLAYAFVPGPHCILRGVRKLPPAYALTWSLDTGAVSCRPYWEPEIAAPAPGGPTAVDELADALHALLADAVRGQLVADVPIGILLSGGLDSSLITATAAAQSRRRLRTFTVAFPGHGRFDESRHARLVAAHFGTEHHELAAGEISPELLPPLARQFDEPMGDSSMLPTFLLASLVRDHATVALGGDGGDELFGGYRYYSWVPRLERLRAVTPAPLRRAVAAVGRALPLGARGRQQLAGFAVDGVPPFAHIDLYFDRAARAELLRPLAPHADAAAVQPEVAKAEACPRDLSPLRGAMVGDFRRYLPDDVLVKVDRASMLASLEVRAPFLDHRVVAFALREVPDALLARRSRRKILLRRLAQRLLPPQFDRARKQGFSVPLARWFGGAWGSFVTSVLTDAEPRLFDRCAVHALLEGQRRGWNNAKRLFALTLFELWRREYGVRVSA
ncbi:MAG TPA: asparagine synthase (glutamine-hydrolyzing) [Gemmatimonadales bacterium]|nr:asparagine synthase (glutamine-hydrolyzing) [Gemmatimonadales bacterium]